MIDSPRFTKINDAFECESCGRHVPPAAATCRNHCPYCLYSKHVDILPGDRANPCKGLLKPVGYHFHKKKGLMIDFKCKRCQESLRTRAILDDPSISDDYDQILKLSPASSFKH